MKKTVFLNFLELSNHRDCNLIVHENGFKLDFSGKVNSHFEKDYAKIPTVGKSSISSMLVLVLFFLFTNFLFAQQPACNLRGSLVALTTAEGGQPFTLTPELKNVLPGTVYKWEFVSNSSGASFASDTALPNITVNPGNIKGGVTLKLTLINPAVITPGSLVRVSKTCTCKKSVSIGGGTP